VARLTRLLLAVGQVFAEAAVGAAMQAPVTLQKQVATAVTVTFR